MNATSKLSADYVSDVLDEIALEGLDGITIEGNFYLEIRTLKNLCTKFL